jgi:hypothetical protein
VAFRHEVSGGSIVEYLAGIRAGLCSPPSALSSPAALVIPSRVMTRISALAGLLLIVMFGGCQVPPKEQTGGAIPAAPNPANTERWDRGRQCAEQAEKVVKRVEAVGREAKDQELSRWTNHYSVKFERCYVQVILSVQPSQKMVTPESAEALLDAFENRVVAARPTKEATSPDVRARYCLIDDGTTNSKGDCAAARAYIDERMNK